MSKVDAQRAMRQARYAAYRASCVAADTPETPSPPTPARVTPTKPPAPSDSPAATAAVDEPAAPALIQVREEAPDDTAGTATQLTLAAPTEPASLAPSTDPNGDSELCGHRNIGNKSCRRPAGHAERNHRYK
jgi:hypothetical protein